jgi:hypothetical protein
MDGMTQVVGCLPNKCEALSSNPVILPKEKKNYMDTCMRVEAGLIFIITKVPLTATVVVHSGHSVNI